MNQTQPQSGQIWSLNPPAGMNDTPAPLVLLLKKENESWSASPVFDGELIAGEHDVLVSDDPEFIDGHCWVAAKELLSIRDTSLWNYLDSIPASTLDQVRRFRDGGVFSLKVGTRIISELNDPRARCREAVIATVKRCIQSSPDNSWVLILQSVGKRVKAARQFVDQVLEEVTVTLSPGLGLPGLNFARGLTSGLVPGDLSEMVGGIFDFVEGRQANAVSFTVAGQEIRLSVSPSDQAWIIGISAAKMSSIKSVTLEQNGELIECVEACGLWWPQSGELEPGRYLVSLKGADETVTFPMELGQTLAG